MKKTMVMEDGYFISQDRHTAVFLSCQVEGISLRLMTSQERQRAERAKESSGAEELALNEGQREEGQDQC